MSKIINAYFTVTDYDIRSEKIHAKYSRVKRSFCQHETGLQYYYYNYTTRCNSILTFTSLTLHAAVINIYDSIILHFY